MVILNISFPDIDGMTTLQAARRLQPVPIMALSDSADMAGKVRALHMGADDYLTKPFDMEELSARVHARLRRCYELTPQAPRPYAISENNVLLIKPETRQALLNGRPLNLTYREYELLSLLVQHPERIFTFEQLYEQVWNGLYMGSKNSVVCEVKRLRKKLGDADLIESVREVGYRFKKT